MKLSEFKKLLESHSTHELQFVLPDGDVIPAHAHITEAGRIDKTFIDCGGTIRTLSNCTLQAWVADDVDHRFQPGKLATVLNMAAEIFRGEDLEVEIEYEECAISQFPVVAAIAANGVLRIELASKHTDCLAKEVCLPDVGCSSGGCCC